MYSKLYVSTSRLQIAYYRAGNETSPKLLLLHGNLSSSEFFLPLFSFLSQWFDVAAPDLRCFGDTQELPVDAKRGYRDWSEDIDSFLKALGWERFSIAGWSMGGNVAIQYAIEHSTQVIRLVLIAPGSPFGFGGTRGENGVLLDPPGLASGGGCVNLPLLTMMSARNRFFLQYILNNLYVKPPFRMNKTWEDLLIDAIAKTKLGKGKYPGNYRCVLQWPYVAAGDSGVLNAMSPIYGNQAELVKISPKPPILWIRGSDDLIVSDHSMLEFGASGSAGIIPGWPGEHLVPPQPMIAQTRYILNQYQENGGIYHELVIPGGHMCFLESPKYFVSALCSFLLQ